VDALHIAKELCATLRQGGHIAYFAGGYVRDLLLGSTSDDIDIATDAEPDEICSLFPDHVLVGAQFGVVLVLIGKYQFEVTTFRKDIDYHDGRRPAAISYKSTPQEDARRRDFTINGMFYDPFKEEVLDFVGGRDDLKKKIIRTIGDPLARFSEDRLRMLRAVRFAWRFDFHLEENTERAITTLAPTLLPAVSMERIWQEFSKMKKGPNFPHALLSLFRLGLLPVILPSLKGISEDTLKGRLEATKFLSERVPTVLYLTLLFAPQEEEAIRNLPYLLKLSKEEGKWVELFLLLHKIDFFKESRYFLAHLLARAQFDITFEVFLSQKTEDERKGFLSWYEKTKEELDFFASHIRKKVPLVKAADLLALGIQPGKEMGMLLTCAEKIAIEENIKDKDTIIERLRKCYLKS
jgi:poly(A) polymerase